MKRELSDEDLLERFDEYLHETWPIAMVCGYEHDPVALLKQIGPTAYRTDFNDWLDSEIGETIEEEGGKYYEI